MPVKERLLEGVPSFAPSFVGTPLDQGHKILSRNTKDSGVSYGENPKLGLGTVPGHETRTDERTDRITLANMCYS